MRAIQAALLAGVSALTVIGAANSAAAAELLINGGFDDIGVGASPESWGGLTYYTDGTHVAPAGIQLPGWSVQRGSVDLTSTTSDWGPAASGSAYSLDLDGWDPGTISQSFDDVAGATYTVSFDYSRNPANAPYSVSALVSAGGQSDTVTSLNDGSFGGNFSMGWKTDSFTFVGSGHDSITLASLDTSGNAGVFFDSVSITGGVPEPATWGLMILGFGGAGALLRRRRAMALAA